MKSPMIVIALAGFSLTIAAQGPASAAQKHQRPPAKYMTMKAGRTAPTVPIEAAAARQDASEDGTGIAIRLQDGHHGDGVL
jgi:hypothetical protein